MRALEYMLGVLMVLVVMVVMVLAILVLGVATTARAQLAEPQIGWQLGICVDDPVVYRRCRLVGAPLPDKRLCEALQASMREKINAGRVHCAKVLME